MVFGWAALRMSLTLGMAVSEDLLSKTNFWLLIRYESEKHLWDWLGEVSELMSMLTSPEMGPPGDLVGEMLLGDIV